MFLELIKGIKMSCFTRGNVSDMKPELEESSNSLISRATAAKNKDSDYEFSSKREAINGWNLSKQIIAELLIKIETEEVLYTKIQNLNVFLMDRLCNGVDI